MDSNNIRYIIQSCGWSHLSSDENQINDKSIIYIYNKRNPSNFVNIIISNNKMVDNCFYYPNKLKLHMLDVFNIILAFIKTVNTSKNILDDNFFEGVPIEYGIYNGLYLNEIEITNIFNTYIYPFII